MIDNTLKIVSSSNLVFKLFANCVPVKGARRSMIYDLGRNEYCFIPNALYEILIRFEGKTISYVKDYYNENESIIDDYFNFLIDNEFIFWCKNDDLSCFPSLNLFWDYPAIITNVIIQMYSKNKLDLNQIFIELSALGCKHYAIHFKNTTKINFIEKILKITKNYPLRSIDFYIPYSKEFDNINLLKKICDDNFTVSKILVYRSSLNEYLYSVNKVSGNIIFTSQKDIFRKNISRSSFVVNTNTFTEAQKYNLFFNRKLIISSIGYVTNSISQKRVKWDFRNRSLLEIIQNEEYKQKWFVNKDLIKICRDCEYRYMCVDSRDPIRINESNWFYKDECGYNPYIAKWYDETDFLNVTEWSNQNL